MKSRPERRRRQALAGGDPPRACVQQAPSRGQRRACQRQRILSYAQTHLRDPGLSAQRAARELGMSRRWLHALLADWSIGFAGFVATRRLEQCRVLLADPGHSHLSITQIAFLAGFNDLSTFYRRFHNRYGTTPSALRCVRKTLGPTGAARAVAPQQPRLDS